MSAKGKFSDPLMVNFDAGDFVEITDKRHLFHGCCGEIVSIENVDLAGSCERRAANVHLGYEIIAYASSNQLRLTEFDS